VVCRDRESKGERQGSVGEPSGGPQIPADDDERRAEEQGKAR
jgi:hypothetical protein